MKMWPSRWVDTVSRRWLLATAALALACAGAAAPPRRAPAPAIAADQREPANALLVPLVDYHRHIQSPAASRLVADPPQPAVALPEDLAGLLDQRTQRWNDPSALAAVYTEHSTLFDPTGPHWIRGRLAVASRMAQFFRRAYRITPIAWGAQGSAGHIAGYFTREEGGSTRYLGHVLLALEKDSDGAWRIAAETPTFAGPYTPEPVTGAQLVADLDAAGIKKAIVLSLAYWFGGSHSNPVDDEYAAVRAENDWTAAEAARFPDRLVAFCSFNPLKDYALQELERCAQNPHLHGLKLHFANSGVDLRNQTHLDKVRQVFRAANAHRWPIVVHLWVTDPTYGREHSAIFLNRILPEAPDIVVQIAHLAGGGSGFNDDAMAVFADAISAHDPRMRNVYFDVTSVADGNQSDTLLRTVAMRIRQVGPERVLFGSDMVPPPAWLPWFNFRMTVPLNNDEFRTIAGNIAPYLR
jgi:predicted TIM-barrel fold metal-dependent hydrolase